MAEEEFKSNSFASKEQKVTKPITTNVVVKQESEATKIRKKFFAEDAKTVGKHVVETVVIPSLQKIISDIVKGGIDFLIYGSKGSRPQSGAGNISYTSYFNRGMPMFASPMVGVNRPSIYAVNDVVFNDRGEAEEVLLRMKEAISNYGMVSVRDFYELIGRRSDHTDEKWGWRDLYSADIIRESGGYMIRFPKVQPLE